MTSSLTNQYAVVVCLLLVFSTQPINAKPANPAQPMGSGSVSQDYMDLQDILGNRLSGSDQEKIKIVDLLLQLLEEIDLPTLCDVIANDTSAVRSTDEFNEEDKVASVKEIPPTEPSPVIVTVDSTQAAEDLATVESTMDTSAMPREMETDENNNEENEKINENTVDFEEEEDLEVDDQEEEEVQEEEIEDDEDEEVETKIEEQEEKIEDVNTNKEESLTSTVNDHKVDMHTSPYWSTVRPLRRRVIIRPRAFPGRINSDGTRPFPKSRRTFRRVSLGDLKKVWLPISKINGVSLPAPINNIDTTGKNEENRRFIIKRLNLAHPRSQVYSRSLILGDEIYPKDVNPSTNEKIHDKSHVQNTASDKEDGVDAVEAGRSKIKGVLSRPKGKIVRRVIYKARKGAKGLKRRPLRYKVITRMSPQNGANRKLTPAGRPQLAKMMLLKRQAMKQRLNLGKFRRTPAARYRILRNQSKTNLRRVPGRVTNPRRGNIVRIPRKFGFYRQPYNVMQNDKKGYKIRQYPVKQLNRYESMNPTQLPGSSVLSSSVQSPTKTTFSARAFMYPTVMSSMNPMTTERETVLPTTEMMINAETTETIENVMDTLNNGHFIENDLDNLVDLINADKTGEYKVMEPLVNYEDIENMVEPFNLKKEKILEYKLSQTKDEAVNEKSEKYQEDALVEVKGNARENEQYGHVSNFQTGKIKGNINVVSETASIEEPSIIYPRDAKPTISETDITVETEAFNKDTDKNDLKKMTAVENESLEKLNELFESVETYEGNNERENETDLNLNENQIKNNPGQDLAPEHTTKNETRNKSLVHANNETQSETTAVPEPYEASTNSKNEDDIVVVSFKKQFQTEFGNAGGLVAESRVISLENPDEPKNELDLNANTSKVNLTDLKTGMDIHKGTTTGASEIDELIDDSSKNVNSSIESDDERITIAMNGAINAINNETSTLTVNISEIAYESHLKTTLDPLLKEETTKVNVETLDTTVADNFKKDNADSLLINIPNIKSDVVITVKNEVTKSTAQTLTKNQEKKIAPFIENNQIFGTNKISESAEEDLTEGNGEIVMEENVNMMDRPDTPRSDDGHVLISPFMPSLSEMIDDNVKDVTSSGETLSNYITPSIEEDLLQLELTTDDGSDVEEVSTSRLSSNVDNEATSKFQTNEQIEVFQKNITSVDMAIPETTQSSLDAKDSVVTSAQFNDVQTEDETTQTPGLLSTLTNYISTQFFDQNETFDITTTATVVESTPHEETRMTSKTNESTTIMKNNFTTMEDEAESVFEQVSAEVSTSSASSTPIMKSTTQDPTVHTTIKEQSPRQTSPPSALETSSIAGVTSNEIINISEYDSLSTASTQNSFTTESMSTTENSSESDNKDGRLTKNMEINISKQHIENKTANVTNDQNQVNETVSVISQIIHIPVMNDSYESLIKESSTPKIIEGEIQNNTSEVENTKADNTESNQENNSTFDNSEALANEDNVGLNKNELEKEILTKNASEKQIEEIDLISTTTEEPDRKLSELSIDQGQIGKKDTHVSDSNLKIKPEILKEKKEMESQNNDNDEETDKEKGLWYERTDANKLRENYFRWNRFGSDNENAMKLAGLAQLARLHGMRFDTKPRTSLYNKLGTESQNNKYRDPSTGEYIPPDAGNIDLWKAYNIAVSQGDNNKQSYDTKDFEKYGMWNPVPWTGSASGDGDQTSSGQSKHNFHKSSGGFPSYPGSVTRGVNGLLYPDYGLVSSPYTNMGQLHEQHWGNRFSQGFYGRVYDGSLSSSEENSHRARGSNPSSELNKKYSAEISEGSEEIQSTDEDNMPTDFIKSPQVVIRKSSKKDDFSEEELRKLLNENSPVYDSTNEISLGQPKKSLDKDVSTTHQPSKTTETVKKTADLTQKDPNSPAGGEMDITSGQWPDTETTGQMGIPVPGDYTCPGMFGYHKDPHDCRSFFICSWGVPYRLHCPAGTRFNPKQSVCDWAVNVDCPQAGDQAP